MASLYPDNLDVFRRYLDRVDYMIAGDLQDQLDAAVAMETELGVEPSGKMGTIFSRLFENGNIVASGGRSGWRPLQWERVAALGRNFNRAGTGFRISYPAARFRGQQTAYGDGVPGFFVAMQSPLNLNGVGAHGRGAVPWRLQVVYVDEDEARMAGVDGEGANLNSANTRSTAIGYIAWNIKTEG